ncbi:MAG: ABC transporter ATP-binding protein [Nocardioides sp.]|jgi:iron(III) transport system ATP-binding protein
MTGLAIAGVTKSFGDTLAVSDVTLDVPSESITTVLGPSGCGKTTLLRLIAGFLDPDAGTIAFGDRVVASGRKSVPPQKRKVGYVPQEGALFPHLDIAANIGFGLPRSQRGGARIAEMLDLVELPAAYASRHPHELSGGQQQRVALARALAPNPSVVLLDEPFSSLDATLRASTGRSVVRALRAARATAVLVTHDQDEALSLADQVAVMRQGDLVQAASPREVYRAPTDPTVARFVGGATVLRADIVDGFAQTMLGRLSVQSGFADGPAEVVVRPEQLRLVAHGDGPTGRVVDVSFYGHDSDVRFDLVPGGPTLVARMNGLEAPEPGDDVVVTIAGAGYAFPVNPTFDEPASD